MKKFFIGIALVLFVLIAIPFVCSVSSNIINGQSVPAAMMGGFYSEDQGSERVIAVKDGALIIDDEGHMKKMDQKTGFTISTAEPKLSGQGTAAELRSAWGEPAYVGQANDLDVWVYRQNTQQTRRWHILGFLEISTNQAEEFTPLLYALRDNNVIGSSLVPPTDPAIATAFAAVSADNPVFSLDAAHPGKFIEKDPPAATAATR